MSKIESLVNTAEKNNIRLIFASVCARLCRRCRIDSRRLSECTHLRTYRASTNTKKEAHSEARSALSAWFLNRYQPFPS